uniref:ATP synthase complex subunit 8 n=1 Tax=Schistometopum thomense TaxID=420425 RepID=C9D8M8_SCHTH|nr:ATP synthase F0 subunit 8 [Schistometopum thomense]
MPQLNPSPWFLIMISSWIIMLTIALTKTIKYESTNYNFQTTLYKHFTPWNWPW